MNRWVSYLLLLSLVRLQFVCCCGEIVHFDESVNPSRPDAHSCCSELSGCCNECDECDHDHPHHHQLLLLNAPKLATSSKLNLESLVITRPLLATCISHSETQSSTGFVPLKTHTVCAVGALKLFGQLRI